jgi:hypothetical protein
MSAVMHASVLPSHQDFPGCSELEKGFVALEERIAGRARNAVNEIAVRIVHSDPVISAGLTELLRKRPEFNVLSPRRSCGRTLMRHPTSLSRTIFRECS